MRRAAWAAVRVRHLADSGGQEVSAKPGMKNMTMRMREGTKRLRDWSRGKVIGGTWTVAR